MKLEYPFSIADQQGGGYVVQFTDFDEAFTEGATVDEARFNAQEVLSLVIEQRIADNKRVPAPSVPGDSPCIAPDASVQAALLVHMTRKSGNKSLSDLARALNTSWPAAQRLENPRHSPTLKQLERAAAALGKRLVLSFDG